MTTAFQVDPNLPSKLEQALDRKRPSRFCMDDYNWRLLKNRIVNASIKSLASSWQPTTPVKVYDEWFQEQWAINAALKELYDEEKTYQVNRNAVCRASNAESRTALAWIVYSYYICKDNLLKAVSTTAYRRSFNSDTSRFIVALTHSDAPIDKAARHSLALDLMKHIGDLDSQGKLSKVEKEAVMEIRNAAEQKATEQVGGDTETKAGVSRAESLVYPAIIASVLLKASDAMPRRVATYGKNRKLQFHAVPLAQVSPTK